MSSAFPSGEAGGHGARQVCGKFLRRNGVSVQAVCGCKPLEFIKRHADRFLLCGAGHVALRRDQDLPEVRSASDSTRKSLGTFRRVF